MEDYGFDMEEMAMKAPAAERKAMKEKKLKREKIRKLKRLINADSYENPDSIEMEEIGDNILNMLKFIKDPMIKGMFNSNKYRLLHNHIVDAASIIKESAMKNADDLLAKI
jgi:hypothetical protein